MESPIERFAKHEANSGKIEIDGDSVHIDAAGKTDWFFDPNGQTRLQNVPSITFPISAPRFTLQAKVSVNFASRYDGGTIFVRTAEDVWAKVAFEYSPRSVPTIVSVVTKGTSDDCDGPQFGNPEVYLRISARDGVFAFHFSEDGKFWIFKRVFSFASLRMPLTVGLSAQSPTGEGCRASFSDIRLAYEAVADFRDGS